MTILHWMIVAAAQATPAAPPPAPAPALDKGVAFRMPPPAKRKPGAYESVGGVTALSVRVAGRDVWAILDSGAERSIVDLALARAAGLTVDPAATVRIRAGGGMTGHRVERVPILVPDQLAIVLPAMVGADLAAISRVMKRPVGLVIGADFHRNLSIVTIPRTRMLQFNPRGALTVPVRPIELLDRPPRMTIELEGKPFVLGIDTGFSGPVMLSPAAWARLGRSDADCETRDLTTADGSRKPYKLCSAGRSRIGPLSVATTKVVINPDLGGDREGMIGMAILGDTGGPTIFDLGSRKLWLLPPGADLQLVDRSAAAPE